MSAFSWGLVLALAACAPPRRCAPADLLGGHACAQEHEGCGGAEGPVCAGELVCVSEMLCAIGPCPGECEAPCATDDDCDGGDTCEGDADERWCVTPDPAPRSAARR